MLMKCDHATGWLDALADGEVRGWRRVALRHHVARCPGCTARLDEVRALRRRMRAELPSFTAPAALRARIEGMRPPVPAARNVARPRPWSWALGGAAGGIALTLVATFAGNALLAGRAADNAAQAMVDEHTHAVLAQREVVVASSDQHTVKPWLSAHLDYSPPVHDFAEAGFPLQGARMVRLQDRMVAVLVYRYRRHAVDVYVQPAGERALPPAATIRGFNVVPLTAQGMQWAIVSDASVESLAALAGAIRGAGP